MTTQKQPTLAVVVGNRGFFPKHLCVEGRATVLKVLADLGIKAIIPAEDRTSYGSVESNLEAHTYADLFKAHATRSTAFCHAAQLWRRARHRQYDALGRLECAGAGAGLH